MSTFAQRWKLDGKVALVTGGTKGIGLACALELAQLGVKGLIVCARTESAIKKAVEAIQKVALARDCRVVGICADVSTESGRQLVVTDTLRHFDGQLDCLINNVGTNKRATIETSTAEDYRRMLTTNIDSCFFLCKAFSAALKTAKGTVVNVASVAGIRSSGTGTIYALTKGAMVQFTRTLSCEWAADGVRVNCVAPWMTMTPLLRAAVEKDPAQIAEAAEATPLQRLAEPEETASVVAFLCLPASSYVTGQVVAVDGGISAQGFAGPCTKKPKKRKR